MRYGHTNLIARDWKLLARFYQDVFGCVPVPPERDQAGEWLEKGTGVPGAALRGVHLRLPGHGASGPTLEVYQYSQVMDAPDPVANRQGYGHLAFEVADVGACVAAVERAGGSRLGEVVTRQVPGAGRITFAYVRDPERNIVEVQRWELMDAGPGPAGPEVRAAYDRWAARYDEQSNPTRDADARVLPRLLPDLAGRDVVEVGCGTGKNTPALLGARSVLALDLSEPMLARARARVRASHVDFRIHDLRDGLPLCERSVDVVTFDLVLEHVAELGPVLTDVARVLRPGGVAVVVELHPFRQLRGARARGEDADGGEPILPPAYVHLVSDFVAAARAAGLAIDSLCEWNDAGEPADAADPALPRLLSLCLRRDR